MKKYFFLISILWFTISGKSQTIEKVTNINYNGDNGLNPKSLTVYNNKLYFLGTDDKYINKLMLTDGTQAGTLVVKQIDTAKKYAFVKGLTVYNNMLIFQNIYLGELWKSDGTTAGTTMIKSIVVSTPFVPLNSKLYFGGNTNFGPPFIDQLFQTDGTTNGTTLVKTINPTGAAGITNIFAFNGKLYFDANNGTDNKQLWISDGTDAGTMMLKKINPTGASNPGNFYAYNGKVYFSANNGSGTQLWVTDGTTAGTVKLTSFNVISPKGFIEFNSKLYFNAINTGSFYQLWVTDGTEQGTYTVKTNHDLINGTRGFNPTSITIHQNKLYMAGYDSIKANTQLWESDGTTAGTLRISDNTIGLTPSFITSYKGLLVMKGYDSATSTYQLWVSNGTKAGTFMPKLPPGSSSAPLYPLEGFVPFNNALYFMGAYQYFADYQLCRFLDPTAGIEPHLSKSIAVYPNPVEDLLTIKTNGNVQELTLTNAMGQIIKKFNIELDSTISLKEITPGIYYLSGFNKDGEKFREKVIKR